MDPCHCACFIRPLILTSLKIHKIRHHYQGFNLNLSYEDGFLEILHDAGYTEANDPCIVQSFDYYSITYMNNNTKLPCVFLRWVDGNPITNQELDQYVKNGLHGIGPDTVRLTSIFILKILQQCMDTHGVLQDETIIPQRDSAPGTPTFFVSICFHNKFIICRSLLE